jgi:hypothetical protein
MKKPHDRPRRRAVSRDPAAGPQARQPVFDRRVRPRARRARDRGGDRDRGILRLAKLKLLKSYAGDGATVAFDLPTDYGRMLKKGKLHSSTWKNASYAQARDEDEWLYLQDTNISGTPGVWILLGGKLQIFPPMPVGETARHYYISNKIVAAADGAAGSKTAFTLDADAFVLSERLLKLALIWRWRSLKRMEYSEDMTNYEIALAEEVAKDKGQRILVSRPPARGRRRLDRLSGNAWSLMRRPAQLRSPQGSMRRRRRRRRRQAFPRRSAAGSRTRI